MSNTSFKQLDNSQLETFDTEYVNEPRWQIIKAAIDHDFPNGNFSFIDIGGGNGRFADRLLDAYPNSNGVVLDNSQLLLDKNELHPRKKLICLSVEGLSQNIHEQYDLVFINWVLHHLISDSYSLTRHNIVNTLAKCQSLLNSNGKISIFENMYNGLMIDNLPSRLIFYLTSSSFILALTRRWANTAGIGVCFLSKKQWDKTVESAGLKTLFYTNDEKWSIPLAWNICLHIGHIRCGHFWLVPSRQ